MPIVVDMPREEEDQVRQAAAAEGVDAATFLRQAAEARLRLCPPDRPPAEADLLEKINQGFPEEFWERYHRLDARRRAQMLTRKEQQELIGLTDQMEARRAERLTHVLELARLRGTTLDAVLDQLGLRPPPVE